MAQFAISYAVAMGQKLLDIIWGRLLESGSDVYEWGLSGLIIKNRTGSELITTFFLSARFKSAKAVPVQVNIP